MIFEIISGGEKTDWVGKEWAGLFFPRGKNGPAHSFPGEKTDWGEIPACYTGLVVLRISGDPVQYCQEILYVCDFSGVCVGGGVRTPCPPSGSAHGTGLCLHLLRYNENPFYCAHRLLYDTSCTVNLVLVRTVKNNYFSLCTN